MTSNSTVPAGTTSIFFNVTVYLGLNLTTACVIKGGSMLICPVAICCGQERFATRRLPPFIHEGSVSGMSSLAAPV